MKIYKFLVLITVIMTSFVAVSQEDANSQKSQNGNNYVSVGEEFSLDNILSAYQMQERYAALQEGDTINASFKADVASVCKKKGCWMNLELEDGSEVMVKFKDYAFFVPKDIEHKEVLVHGKAFVTELSVDEQRHYAEDAGKSPEEVKAIVAPAKTLSFVASGVKIEE